VALARFRELVVVGVGAAQRWRMLVRHRITHK
jgi:hypothetical protein